MDLTATIKRAIIATCILEKRCTQCKLYKPIKQFYKIHRAKHLMSECKQCYKARVKEHNKDPKVLEVKRKQKRINYQNDTEKHLKWAKVYRDSHREITRLRTRLSQYKKKAKELGIDCSFERPKQGTESVKNLKRKIKILKDLICKNKKQIN